MESVGIEETNISHQGEEIEALGAIYGEDFVLEDESPPSFSITIRVGDKENEECVLTVSFPWDYPESAPPMYQLSIPWLRGEQKQNICTKLEELYLDHIGESVVYLWVECIREILHAKTSVADESMNSEMLDVKNLSLQSDKDTDKDDTLLENSPSDNNVSSFPSIKITTGEPFTDRKSTFQAHVATITEVHHTKFVLSELYKNKKIATATHNMYAYRICKEGSQNCVQDCDDDGETHAGSRLLHLLQILDCKNVIIVVTRWYGGIQLHGDRFKFINNVARQLLDSQGYISQKSSKK